VTLTVSVDQPLARLAARLCAVAPGGASTLVTWGLLNLTHRDGHTAPEPLEPGRRYTVTFKLNAIGQQLPAGHRWRLALSTDYWPMAWPSPQPVTLTLYPGAGTRLTLPVRAPHPADSALPAFGPPEHAAPPPMETTRTGTHARTFERDLVSGKLVTTNVSDSGGTRYLDNGAVLDDRLSNTYIIYEGQPLSARVECEWQIALSRGDWAVRVETRSVMTADAEHFHVTNSVEAYEGQVRVSARTWEKRIARDGG
jgi:hypothetical protein